MTVKVLIRKYVDYPVPDWVLDHKVTVDIYTWFMNKIYDFREKRRVNVRIDPWDTWNMDHTLAYIILPMLEQLVDTKHGAPRVDDEDVPEELRSTSAPPKENEYDTDENHFKRWDWVLDEMIYSFRAKIENEETYFKFEDPEEIKRESERRRNGFRLFGKYYEALWD
jgi:hypothetical protein